MVNNEASKRTYSGDSLLGVLMLLYASSSFLNIYSNWVNFIPYGPLVALIGPYWDILYSVSLLIANVFLVAISIKVLNMDDIRNINRGWVSLFLLFYLVSRMIILLRDVWINVNVFIIDIFSFRHLIYVSQILLGALFLSRLITKNKIIDKKVLVLISLYLIIYSVNVGQAMISVFNEEGLFSFTIYIFGVYFVAVTLAAFIVTYKTLKPNLDILQGGITASVKTIFVFVSFYYMTPLVYLGFINPESISIYNNSVVFLANAAVQFIFGFIILIYPNKIISLRNFMYSTF